MKSTIFFALFLFCAFTTSYLPSAIPDFVLKVCVLVLFLVGVTTAAMDLNHLGSNHHDDSSDEPSESSEPCCDSCICTKSIPPQCHCTDIRLNSCHSACKSCMCTRSMPGKCRCLDVADFCYKPCKSRDEDDEKDEL
nr:trypsin proteinase inhibitor [synthetic construct]